MVKDDFPKINQGTIACAPSAPAASSENNEGEVNTSLFSRIIGFFRFKNGPAPETNNKEEEVSSASCAAVETVADKKAARLFASAAVASAEVASDGRLFAVSDNWRDFFKSAGERDADDEPGAFPSLFMPEDRDAVKRAIANRADEARPLRGSARKPDGSVGTFDLHINASAPADVLTVIIVDQTESANQQKKLAQAADKARAEARAGASTLADLSHEMKTPLNAVIGFADTMRIEAFGPLGNEKYKEYAEHIRTSGKHLLDLVVSLLDMARIEADRLTLSKALTSPDVIACESAEMVRHAVEGAGLKLQLDVADELPEAMIDPRAVRQILLNLLTNAAKFTSDGEVRLAVEKTDLNGAAHIAFTVSDTGIGMSEADLAKLGPRFTKAHGAGVRGADGAGLGLSLVFKLAELHGGGVELSSAPGEGLTARVLLPVGAPRRAANERIRKNEQEKTPQMVDVNEEELPQADESAPPNGAKTQLERIEAYRKEIAARRSDAA